MRNISVALITLWLSFACSVYASEDDFLSMSFEELLQIKVSVASGIDESIKNAPASLVVISRQDLQNRGYQSLSDVIADLPGFDTLEVNGFSQVAFYQRGYRTPATTRTLLMINGVVDNHLWSQQAYLSRQYPISNIKHVEVLYGPASAIYGANAFAGIINVVTLNAEELAEDEFEFESKLISASYSTKALDFGIRARKKELSYNFSARYFKTDGPNLDDFNSEWGYINNQLLSDEQVWGALLNNDTIDKELGSYASPAIEYGVLGDLNYKNFKLGLIHWKVESGYGVYYAADHGQPNASWQHQSSQFWGEHQHALSHNLSLETQLLYRENRTWGDWAEAIPDWREGFEDYSFISYSNWNTVSDSVLVKQNIHWNLDKGAQITAGLKYERKHLTKSYTSCGYWADAFCPNQDVNNLGPVDLGNGVSHSSLTDYQVIPSPPSGMPSENLITTVDKGVFIQGIFDYQNFRIQGGLRYDDNNIYGSVINPRAALIYHQNEDSSVKLLYGEAYQEPSAQLRWGGWNGRNENPDLKPESVKNLELMYLHQGSHLLHEVSLFSAKYYDVIKEEAENAGERDIIGLEYRGRFQLSHWLNLQKDIEGYFNYTYTSAKSDLSFDHELQQWINLTSYIGDIAPHKFNAGIDLPFEDRWNLHFGINYVSSRQLYSRNTLRGQGEEIDAYHLLNTSIQYKAKNYRVDLGVKNLLNESYYHPGGEQAASGNDFTQPAQGFHNSLLIQTGRSFFLTFSYQTQ